MLLLKFSKIIKGPSMSIKVLYHRLFSKEYLMTALTQFLPLASEIFFVYIFSKIVKVEEFTLIVMYLATFNVIYYVLEFKISDLFHRSNRENFQSINLSELILFNLICTSSFIVISVSLIFTTMLESLEIALMCFIFVTGKILFSGLIRAKYRADKRFFLYTIICLVFFSSRVLAAFIGNYQLAIYLLLIPIFVNLHFLNFLNINKLRTSSIKFFKKRLIRIFSFNFSQLPYRELDVVLAGIFLSNEGLSFYRFYKYFLFMLDSMNGVFYQINIQSLSRGASVKEVTIHNNQNILIYLILQILASIFAFYFLRIEFLSIAYFMLLFSVLVFFYSCYLNPVVSDLITKIGFGYISVCYFISFIIYGILILINQSLLMFMFAASFYILIPLIILHKMKDRIMRYQK